MTQTNDMTQGPLGRQILVFSLPLVFTNLLQVLFNMADIAVVGRFSGVTALGAVGSTSIVVLMFTGFLQGLGTGVNVLTARFLGEKNDDAVRRTVHTACVITAAAGAVLLLLGELFSRSILVLMGTKEEYLEQAVLYLRIYLLGMPSVALFNFGNAVLGAHGDTRRPFLYLSFAGVLNILLNLFFVIVLGMAADGVSLASILSQTVSAALVLRALLREDSAIRLSPRRLRPDPALARGLLALGLPAGLQNSIFSLANMFIQAGVNTFDAVMVAGNSAAVNADGIVYDVMAAFYTACSSFMSQNYGARKNGRILRSYRLCLIDSFAVGLVLSVLLLLLGPHFLSLFTAEPAVIDAGMQRLQIMCFSYAFSAFMDCTIAANRGLGYTAVPMVIVILGSCVFRVAWVYTIFAAIHTVPSLYLLYIFSWAITAAAEIVYFVHLCHVTGITSGGRRSAGLQGGN